MLRIARNLLKLRGTHVITCPENHEHAAVRVALLTGGEHASLKTCSRWPEKEGCDQACVKELEASPRQTLVQAIASDWYIGKSCVYCGHAIEDIVWHERPPALLSPEHTTVQWKDVAPQQLPEILGSHEPVCYRCHVVESFRREHTEWVIERPRVAEQQEPLKASTAVY